MYHFSHLSHFPSLGSFGGSPLPHFIPCRLGASRMPIHADALRSVAAPGNGCPTDRLVNRRLTHVREESSDKNAIRVHGKPPVSTTMTQRIHHESSASGGKRRYMRLSWSQNRIPSTCVPVGALFWTWPFVCLPLPYLLQQPEGSSNSNLRLWPRAVSYILFRANCRPSTLEALRRFSLHPR